MQINYIGQSFINYIDKKYERRLAVSSLGIRAIPETIHAAIPAIPNQPRCQNRTRRCPTCDSKDDGRCCPNGLWQKLRRFG